MGKIMAQRKFAQGVYVPPHSAQITNRKVTDLVKDQTNIIRRQTTAKVLLDVISLENIHKHKPVVLLERLRNVDAVENIIAEPDNSLLVEVNSTPSVPIKSVPQTQITGRNPLLKKSGPKKNPKRSIRNRHKVKQRRNPTRKAAFKASLRWKYTSAADNEFSVDDDQPLTYFTRSGYINGSRQSSNVLGSKKNNSGPKSTPSYGVERLPPVNNRQEPSTIAETDAVLEPSMNDVEAGSTLHVPNTEQPTQNNVEAGSTLHVPNTEQPTQNNVEAGSTLHVPNTEQPTQNNVEAGSTLHVTNTEQPAQNNVEAGSTLHVPNTEQPTQNNAERTLQLTVVTNLYDDDMLIDSKSDIYIQDAVYTGGWRAPPCSSQAPFKQIPDPSNDETQPGPSGLRSRSRSSLRRGWRKSEPSDTSPISVTSIDDYARSGTSGVQSNRPVERTPDDDGAQPGPSGVRSSAQGSINGGVQSGSSRNQGRKGKAKDKSKCAPPPDTAQPGPSLQSRSHAQSDIELNQSDRRAQSPINLESSYDDNSHRAASPTNSEESLANGISRAEDPESKNNMIQVWLENGIFKVPTVPKARTPQNSSHANMEEERPRRHQQSGGRRSNAPSLRAGSERSISPMSFVTALDNTEPEQVIDAAATEITVPTRRDRIQMLPPRRQRARFQRAKLADAPVFCPTEDEFKDPVTYFEKIMPRAAKYGLCKVVAPPGFKPECNLNDAMRFTVFNQYITRVFRRWSTLTREMCTMRSHLATLKIACTQPPLLGGMEVNLPKLYESVNNNGGIKNMNKKAWAKVAEELNCGKLSHPDRRLDQLYMKYVVPYNSLSKRERKEMVRKVDELWQKRHRRMLDRASNPLHTQKHTLGESDSSDDDGELEDERRFPHIVKQLKEAEECIVKGRPMDLLTFKRIANNVQKRYLPTRVTMDEIENSYWSSALMAEHHVCVHSASIETSSEGYGFTNNANEPYGQHPWNLKMLNQNNGNILRLLGSVVGLTIPTLHLGMLYSTSCWHRDPHGLPWMEYMHDGPPKIWYGIPDEESERFRRAVEILCPTSCQNKSIWLPSDITMIPPNFLLEHSVSLTRMLQNPGEFVIVFPKAYSCSIATGFTVSESVYFAYNHWINNIGQVFQELRDSCEPSMFSLEHLLISAAKDPRATLNVLQLVHASMSNIVSTELAHRAALVKHGLEPRFEERNNPTGIVWNISEEDECEICRANLYLSRVNGVFDRDGALCVGHALQVLDERVQNLQRRSQCHYDLVIYMTETELKQIVERISKIIVDVRMAQAFPRVV